MPRVSRGKRNRTYRIAVTNTNGGKVARSRDVTREVVARGQINTGTDRVDRNDGETGPAELMVSRRGQAGR